MFELLLILCYFSDWLLCHQFAVYCIKYHNSAVVDFSILLVYFLTQKSIVKSLQILFIRKEKFFRNLIENRN